MYRSHPSPSPAVVISTMREIKQKQVSLPSMNQEAVKLIFELGLLHLHQWPSWHIVITDAGAEYISENGGEE